MEGDGISITMSYGNFFEEYVQENGGVGCVLIEHLYQKGMLISVTIKDKDMNERGLDFLGRPFLAQFTLQQPSPFLTPETIGVAFLL